MEEVCGLCAGKVTGAWSFPSLREESFRVFAPYFGGSEVHTAAVNCRLAGQQVKVADH